MVNNIQEGIYAAIDAVAKKRIEELKLDKTIIASIEQLVDATSNRYKVQYKGGSMYAYAKSNEAYPPHTSVYVSIPQNDYSNKKWIVGKVTSVLDDKNITEIATALEDFQIVGKNTVSLVNKDNYEFGLRSWKGKDSLTLYSRVSPEKNVLSINNKDLQTYIKDSKALLIEATFRTDLDSIQKNKQGAEYSLSFDLVFVDGDNTYNIMQEKFNDYAEKINVVVKGEFEEDGSPKTISLKDSDREIRKLVALWEQFGYTGTEDADSEDYKYNNPQFTISVQKAFVEAMQGQFSELENQLIIQYVNLLNQMLEYLPPIDSTDLPTNQDWCKEYRAWFEQSVNTLVVKPLVYTLDTKDMIGNPLLFRVPAEQYNIYPIDTGRFQYIDNIRFECSGFTSSSDWDTKPTDIFVSDIEFYGLQELSSINGDFRLKLAFPEGQVFNDSAKNDDKLTIEADMTYKNVDLIGVSYYWFKKDGLIKNASNENYHYLGGIGWKWFKNKDLSEDRLTVSSEGNTAYDNIYKCVAVYETMILKTEFVIYNETNHRIIRIDSNYLSNKFMFDAGEPVLTCKILDTEMVENEPISVPDKYIYQSDNGENCFYYFYEWVRKNQQGQVFALQSYDSLLAQYDIADFEGKMQLKPLLNEMEGTTLDKNILKYLTKNIATDSSMIFECHVYRSNKEKPEDVEKTYLGCGSIVLSNQASAEINTHYIVIENGDQVFQYSESGVTPCSEQYTDPLVPKKLICHLFDPTGSEVNPSLYTVRWEYPVSNSLLVPPTEGMKENPATGLIQWYNEDTAPVSIASEYNYDALDNQIKCIVVYDTVTYTKNTEFYFGKIGDNGTNGTDVVAKIEPWVEGNVLDNEPLTLVVKNNKAVWNSGLVFNDKTTPVELKLYRKGQYVDSDEYKNVKWTMAGGATKSNKFTAQASSIPHLGNVYIGQGKYSNYILKGEAKLAKVDGSKETQTHYAFYPINVIEYESNAAVYNISINKNKTLKHILYNADGRNPVYNENQGIFFDFSEDEDSPFTVSWEAFGGLTENEDTPAFDLYYDKDILKNETVIVPANTLAKTIENCPYVYIKPKDVYTGAAQNNHVKATIYATVSANGVKRKILVATAYIPIYMSLNLYGLASLNAWDGNTIEINEDNNYIMAPQIGAGIKNADNTFTGIVMGKATTYDMEKEQVGLLGYSSGRQSIFLDAETGNATFGLSEQDEHNANQENLSEGRIELRPGGLSSIAKWKINSRSLFNVPDANAANTEDYNTWGGLMNGYNNNYIKSIPHNRSGIMLSSDPSYISVKGYPLTKDTSDISFDSSNVLIQEGDSFELEINPNLRSLFTIYRHTPITDENVKVEPDNNGWKITGWEKKDGTDTFVTYSIADVVNGQITWTINNLCKKDNSVFSFIGIPVLSSSGQIIRWNIKQVKGTIGARYPVYEDPIEKILINYDDDYIWKRDNKVGIDSQGRFYTNALKATSTALNIEAIGAFGKTASQNEFVGASFEVGENPENTSALVKMFCESGAVLSSAVNPLYISGGTNIENEYERPMSLHGASVGLYTTDERDEERSKETNSKITINPNAGFIGLLDAETKNDVHTISENIGSYLRFNREDVSELHTKKTFSTIVGSNQDETDSDRFWLYQNFAPPSGRTDNANKITQLSEGSIANYAYGKRVDIKENESGGHILNYGSGCLQFNRIKRTKDETTGEYSYGIDKALQISSTNVFLGCVDSLKTTDYDRAAWIGESIGTTRLLSNVSAGAAFEYDSNGTTLISNPRIGVYCQSGIDIRTLGTTGKIIRIESESSKGSSHLLLRPEAGNGNYTAVLASRHGEVGLISSARNGYVSTTESKNGFLIDPGLTAGYGIFTGTIGDGSNSTKSIYATNDIYSKTTINGTTVKGGSLQFSGNKTGVNTSGGDQTLSSNDVWAHLENLYKLVKKAQNKADSAYNGNGSVPSHRHSLEGGYYMRRASDSAPYVTVNDTKYTLSNYLYGVSQYTGYTGV